MTNSVNTKTLCSKRNLIHLRKEQYNHLFSNYSDLMFSDLINDNSAFSSLPSARSQLPGRKVTILRVTQAPGDRQIQTALLRVIRLSCANTSQHQPLLLMSDSRGSLIRGGQSPTPSELALKREVSGTCTYWQNFLKSIRSKAHFFQLELYLLRQRAK